jgi:hypothetical protein
MSGESWQKRAPAIPLLFKAIPYNSSANCKPKIPVTNSLRAPNDAIKAVTSERSCKVISCP